MEEENNMIMELIKNRRSCRKYLNKNIPDTIVKNIIQCGMNAPFGGKPKPECQVTEYIVINDRDIKEKLSLEYDDRQFIKNAPVIIAILANKDNDLKYKEYTVSSALAIQNMIIASESLGIGTCILSCFINDEKHIEDKMFSRKILNLPDNLELIALLVLGYKDNAEIIPKKELKKFEEIVYYNKYE